MRTVKAKASIKWVNRIVGYGEDDPEQLLANPQNWRIHPLPQQQALEGVLSEVGIVQNIIVNKRTSDLWGRDQGVETLVDGHLRVSLALSAGQPSIPITYVDLTPAEEAEVLATIDPLSSMAVTDKGKLDELLEMVETDSQAVADLLSSLATPEKANREDRSLEEIDLATLPVRPVWVLVMAEYDLLPALIPVLDQLRTVGARVEVSNDAES